MERELLLRLAGIIYSTVLIGAFLLGLIAGEPWITIAAGAFIFGAIVLALAIVGNVIRWLLACSA